MIDDLSKAILNAQRMTILTGAGISVNAGVPDFRGEQGIYTTVNTANTFLTLIILSKTQRFSTILHEKCTLF